MCRLNVLKSFLFVAAKYDANRFQVKILDEVGGTIDMSLVSCFL